MSEVCNIGRKGITSRWIGGLAALGLIAIVLPTTVFRELSPLWRLWLVAPLFVAFLSFFQAGAKT